MKAHHFIAALFCSATLIIPAQGFADPDTGWAKKSQQDHPPLKPPTISLPADTALVVVVNAKGETRFLDRQGERLPPCKFCDDTLEKKLGPGCKKAEYHKVSICPGTTTTNIKAITPLSLYRTTGSACYGGVNSGGQSSGTCYDPCITFGFCQ